MKKSDRDRKDPAAFRGAAVNVLGILLAFGVAFGGVFLVQEGLARETAGLLQEGGEVLVPVRSEASEASGVPGADCEEAPKKLTEEELLAAVGGLKGTEESYPHEPLQGQLSMAQAIEGGREWLEDFFLPHLEMSGDVLRECRINCYLWTRQVYSGTGGQVEDGLISYWTVGLDGQELDAGLVLNAVSGQVLEASVTVRSPVEYQARDSMAALLLDYAESFGTTEDYVIIDERSGNMYQGIGDSGLTAVLKIGEIVVAGAEDEEGTAAPSMGGGTVPEYTELLYIRLSLEQSMEAAVSAP